MAERGLSLLVHDLRTGRLTRRQAVSRLIALGMSASGISAVLAGGSR